MGKSEIKSERDDNDNTLLCNGEEKGEGGERRGERERARERERERERTYYH